MDSLREGVVAASAGVGAQTRDGGEVEAHNDSIVAADSNP